MLIIAFATIGLGVIGIERPDLSTASTVACVAFIAMSTLLCYVSLIVGANVLVKAGYKTVVLATSWVYSLVWNFLAALLLFRLVGKSSPRN